MSKTCLMALVTACVVFSGTVTSEAVAEDRSPQELAKISDQALDHAGAGRYKEAIRLWLDIIDEFPVGGRIDLHVNLALAYERIGQLPETWYHLDRALSFTHQKDPQLVAELARIEARLTKSHGKLVLQCVPEGNVVLKLKEGPFRVTCPMSWWFLPGKHGLRITAEGYKATDVNVTMKTAGQVLTAEVKLTAEGDQPKPIEDPTKGKTVTPKKGTPMVWKWAAIGGGAALVAVGGTLQYLGYSAHEDLKKDYPADPKLSLEVRAANQKAYNDGFDTDVAPKMNTAYAMYGIGGAAIVGGVVWMLLDRPSKTGTASNRFWIPTVTDDSAGVVFGFSF